MTTSRDSALRPLADRAADLDLLRGGGAGEAERRQAILSVQHGVDATLRRLLRDDATAPVELRLRALAPEDLPTETLLAELRQRERIPVELAAAIHELAATAGRLAAGAAPDPRDADLALRTADGVAGHLRSLPAPVPLEDPALASEDTLIPPAPEDPTAVHDVPSFAQRPHTLRYLVGAALFAGLLLVVFWMTRDDGERLRQGEEHLRAGRRAEAATLFREHVEAHPADPTGRIHLSRIYRRERRFEDARGQIRAALQSSPEDPRVHAELGFLLLDSGRPRDAARAFRRAIALDPRSTGGWGGLVRALRAGGDAVAAERALRQAPVQVRALLTPRAAP